MPGPVALGSLFAFLCLSVNPANGAQTPSSAPVLHPAVDYTDGPSDTPLPFIPDCSYKRKIAVLNCFEGEGDIAHTEGYNLLLASIANIREGRKLLGHDFSRVGRDFYAKSKEADENFIAEGGVGPIRYRNPTEEEKKNVGAPGEPSIKYCEQFKKDFLKPCLRNYFMACLGADAGVPGAHPTLTDACCTQMAKDIDDKIGVNLRDYQLQYFAPQCFAWQSALTPGDFVGHPVPTVLEAAWSKPPRINAYISKVLASSPIKPP